MKWKERLKKKERLFWEKKKKRCQKKKILCVFDLFLKCGENLMEKKEDDGLLDLIEWIRKNNGRTNYFWKRKKRICD